MSHPSNELSESALDALVVHERARVVAPLTDWQSLSERLREEGIIREPAGSSSRVQVAAPPAQRTSMIRWGVRVVAGAALVGCGVVIGSTLASPERDTDSSRMPTIQMAANEPEFQSLDEARQVLARSQADWQRAVAYLSVSDSAEGVQASPDEVQERLRALDKVMLAAQSALGEAPSDPLLNQYYMSTFSARQATLQQLQATPVGARMTRF